MRPLLEGSRSACILLLFVLGMGLSQETRAQLNDSVSWGEAEGPVGPGQTQEDTVEALYLLARRDAASKVLALVGSDTRVRSIESERGVFEYTSDEARAVTLAEMQEVAGTKEIERRLDDEGTLWISVRAGFHVEPKVVDEQLASISASSVVSQTESRGNIEVLLDRINGLEDQLDLLARDPDASLEDLRHQIGAVKAAYQSLSGAVAVLSGASIADQLRAERDSRLRSVYSYLLSLRDIAVPAELFNIELVGNPEVEDWRVWKGEQFVKLTIGATIEVRQDRYEHLQEVFQKGREVVCDWTPPASLRHDTHNRQYGHLMANMVVALADEQGDILVLSANMYPRLRELRYTIEYLPQSYKCDRGTPNEVAIKYYTGRRSGPLEIPSTHHGRSLDVELTLIVPERILERVAGVRALFLKKGPSSMGGFDGFEFSMDTWISSGRAVPVEEVELTPNYVAMYFEALARDVERASTQ